jgi:hypothetical protein
MEHEDPLRCDISLSHRVVHPGVGPDRRWQWQWIALAQKSPAIQTAYNYLIGQAQQLQDTNLRTQTLDAITNPSTCVMHRAHVTPAVQQTILNQLLAAGLVDPNDNANFPGGLIAGVFPAIVNDGWLRRTRPESPPQEARCQEHRVHRSGHHRWRPHLARLGRSIVFQWNADGSEFPELNFGGNGVTDAWGAAGNSKTGGHHLISIAESIARGFSPAFVRQ